MTSFWIGFVVGAIIFGLLVGYVCRKHPKKSAEVLTKLENDAKDAVSKIKN